MANKSFPKSAFLPGHDELFSQLSALAMDLRWTWDHATDKIWRQLDPVLWEKTQNPLVVLQTVSRRRIKEAFEDTILQDIIHELTEAKRQHLMAPAWFQQHYPGSPLSGIAFFCMEFMLSEALPIYSGGLGNVAGDHLKTASDLGVPLFGVGLLFQQGYSRQVIYADGSQQYVTPFNDPGQLPVSPLRDENGEWLRIEIKLPGHSVWLRTWKAQVGRASLYLLDSNDEANFPVHRGITNELYGGDSNTRLLQELVLGIGGWRLLKALNLRPEVVHLNEGHAAFVVVERAASLMQEMQLSFEEAMTVARAGNLFTTHSATGAGSDQFAPSMIEHYLGQYITEQLKIDVPGFLALGRRIPSDQSEPFQTAVLALHGSAYVNGVSRLHGEVSRSIYAQHFPRWPLTEVPVGHITNGVHMSTWDSAEADSLWTSACGKDRWLHSLKNLTKNIAALSDDCLWKMRMAQKQNFIDYIRYRYAQQLATIGLPAEEVEKANAVFLPGVLTIGFARRFMGYKRTNLLLANRDRLKWLLLDENRPLHLVIAGKAHPGDTEGYALVREWIQFIRKENLQHKIVFLSDYDMHLSAHLVQGVDLWINTPHRLQEACGTSGMKVLVNGGLNLSELDGWWDEVYSPEYGWAIGDRSEHENGPDRDAAEAVHLYDLLEKTILPAFYQRNAEGIPEKWIGMVRQSMACLTPKMSSNRSMREYVETYYLPAAKRYLDRLANNGEKGKTITEWTKKMGAKWQGLATGKLSVCTNNDVHHFSVDVCPGELSLTEIDVQLYAEEKTGFPVEKHHMNAASADKNSIVCFHKIIPAAREAGDYSVRIIPVNRDLQIPLELPLIRWLQ